MTKRKCRRITHRQTLSQPPTAVRVGGRCLRALRALRDRAPPPSSVRASVLRCRRSVSTRPTRSGGSPPLCRRAMSTVSVYATYVPCALYANIWSTFPLYSVVHSTLCTPAILNSRLRRDLHFADRAARRRRCVGGLCLRDLRAPKPGIPPKTPLYLYCIDTLQGFSGTFRDFQRPLGEFSGQ